MPSKDTTVLSVRVKNETLDFLNKEADSKGISVARYLDSLTEEPETDIAEQEESIYDYEYEDLGFTRMLKLFRDKKYPDRAIRQSIEQICEQISEGGNYRAKREDWA